MPSPKMLNDDIFYFSKHLDPAMPPPKMLYGFSVACEGEDKIAVACESKLS
jgi:hypothetical protein